MPSFSALPFHGPGSLGLKIHRDLDTHSSEIEENIWISDRGKSTSKINSQSIANTNWYHQKRERKRERERKERYNESNFYAHHSSRGGGRLMSKSSLS